jgi:acyl carrier protein
MPPGASFSDVQESPVGALMGALIRIGIEPSEIDMEVSLRELDVTSLDMVEIIEIIREELDLELQGPDVMACETLQDMADLIIRQADEVRSCVTPGIIPAR